jgi:TolB-like protein
VFIAYQFVDGETLAKRLVAGPLPLPDLLRLARGAAEALVHAHGRDVLHRDLTAGNVMLRSDGSPVIVDFGLARASGDVTLTGTGTTLGTAPYLAPEQWRGETGDARTDLWSLGVVLYYAATGQQPFGADAQEAVMYRVLSDEPVKPTKLRAELPAEFERLVLRLLEKDPRDRIASAAELAAGLQFIAGAEPESTVPRTGEAPVARLKRWWRRRARRRYGPAQLVWPVLAAGTLAASLWFAAYRGWLPVGKKDPDVVAVIPFENTSAAPEEVAYLGEGLGDELVTKLGQASGYRVLPWATTRALAGTKKPFPVLARDLHVTALLVGTFRADQERVRVTASLVDGRSGVQRWSHSFDEPLTDLMSLQANIATSVASEIEGQLEPAEQQALSRKPSTSPEAYAIYLQGAAYLYSDDFGTRSLARPFFERAIELDSSLASAYAGRGAAELDEHFRGLAGQEDVRKARLDFTRALRLQPDLRRAETGLVAVGFEVGRPEDMLQIAARATARGDNDVDGLNTRGIACTLSGFAEASLPLFERALALDPGNQQAAWYQVTSLPWADQYGLALERGKEYIRRFGEDSEIYFWMGVSAAMTNSDREANAFLDRALEMFGDDNSDLYSVSVGADYFDSLHRPKRAEALVHHWIPLLRERAERTPDNYRILAVLIGLEGFARDTVQMKQHIGLYAERIRSDPDFNPSGLVLSLPGIFRSGSRTALQLALEAPAGHELGCYHHILRRWLDIGPEPRPSESSMIESGQFQSFKQAVRARRDELGRRYLPLVALHRQGS